MPTSTYRGVSWVQAKRRWNCSISVGNKTKSLGTFLDEAEAARAYDMAAIKEHPAPILNFLADGSLNPNRKQAMKRTARPRNSAPPPPPPKPPVEQVHPPRQSMFRGVFWNATAGRWRACISVGNLSRSLGYYHTDEEAAHAYDKAAKEFHVNPVTNFLDNGQLNPERKKVVWSQKVSPQQRDKKAIEERKRKVTEQQQTQKRHEAFDEFYKRNARPPLNVPGIPGRTSESDLPPLPPTLAHMEAHPHHPMYYPYAQGQHPHMGPYPPLGGAGVPPPRYGGPGGYGGPPPPHFGGPPPPHHFSTHPRGAPPPPYGYQGPPPPHPGHSSSYPHGPPPPGFNGAVPGQQGQGPPPPSITTASGSSGSLQSQPPAQQQQQQFGHLHAASYLTQLGSSKPLPPPPAGGPAVPLAPLSSSSSSSSSYPTTNSATSPTLPSAVAAAAAAVVAAAPQPGEADKAPPVQPLPSSSSSSSLHSSSSGALPTSLGAALQNDSDDEDRASANHQLERENTRPSIAASSSSSSSSSSALASSVRGASVPASAAAAGAGAAQRRSKFMGVDWDAGSSKWRAVLTVKGKQEVLGLFDKEMEAAQCYDDASAKQHVQSNLNFLSNGSVNPLLEELEQVEEDA